jgi:hypothetical protein
MILAWGVYIFISYPHKVVGQDSQSAMRRLNAFSGHSFNERSQTESIANSDGCGGLQCTEFAAAALRCEHDTACRITHEWHSPYSSELAERLQQLHGGIVFELVALEFAAV